MHWSPNSSLFYWYATGRKLCYNQLFEKEFICTVYFYTFSEII